LVAVRRGRSRIPPRNESCRERGRGRRIRGGGGGGLNELVNETRFATALKRERKKREKLFEGAKTSNMKQRPSKYGVVKY
jgi:hypothetical protein